MKRFFYGALVGALILVALPVIAIAVGAINMSATQGPGLLETTLAGWTVDRSVALRAPRQSNPLEDDPQAIEAGLAHYRGMCLACHGAPDVAAGEFAHGLNPQPPDLARAAKDWTDGELFWITKHGIRMTGMPAFGATHNDEELWKIVAFLRRLDNLSETQVAMLGEGAAADHHHGEAGHSHEATAEADKSTRR